MKIKDIINNPAICKHLRWDMIMEKLICKKKNFSPEDAGFYFCICVRGNNARLVLLHLYPDGEYILEAMEGFPQDLIISAIDESGGIETGGYTANKERDTNVREARYYPINKPIIDILKSGIS